MDFDIKAENIGRATSYASYVMMEGGFQGVMMAQ